MDEHYSGISEYAANLLSALLRLDQNNDYRLFYNSFHNLDKRLDVWRRPNARIVKTHWPNKIFNYGLVKIFHYPKLDRVLGGVDVFWSPHFNFTSLTKPPVGPRTVITVHDLSFLRYPEFFSIRKNFWHQALNVKATLMAADKIIAVSENTKNDLIELAGVNPAKIAVIYSGNNIAKREVSREEKREFLLKHELLESGSANADPGRLILYLGNIEPRKNIQGLIEAFNILRAGKVSLGVDRTADLKLILAGADGWKNKKIYAAWQNSPYRDDIKFLGYISKKDKEILYSLATVFAYPSFYEGFGFPPLEAMTCGLPVVCSNVSSLPEVVGDAAVMIDPFRPEEIAQALGLILSDEALRQRLISRAYERAALFTWNKAAAAYLKIFSEMYADQK
jgi:glycosyltransferase involved in cell wall biosynthesis